MKTSKLILAGLSAAIIAVGIMTVMPVKTQPQPAAAQQASDKYDGDCTGQETAGRCADKCPADTAEGTYYVMGYDKVTGAAVCKMSFYNECPYAASYSATDPMCDKFAAQQQPATQPAATAPPSNQCGGSK